MHHIDFNSKTKKMVVRFALYSLIGVIAAIITLIIVLAARGYDIDRETGQIIQNGLVIIESSPASAEIYINKKFDNRTTPSRLSLPEESYRLGLELEGYRPWTTSLVVEGSEVTWLPYPRLIPKKTNKVITSTLPKVSKALQTTDRESIYIQPSNSSTLGFLFDSANPGSDVARINLPKSLLRNNQNNFSQIELQQWSNDRSKLLMTHSYSKKVDYLLVDIQNPASSVNLSKLFAISFTDVKLALENPDVFWAQSAKGLRRYEISSKKISESLLDQIISFDVESADRSYAVISQAGQHQIYQVNKDQEPMAIIRVDKSEKPVLKQVSYDRQAFLLVSDGSQLKLYKNTDNQEDWSLEHAFARQDNSEVMISPQGQSIAIKNGTRLSVYSNLYQDAWQFALGQANKNVQWLDDFHLFSQSSQAAFITDFDGQNTRKLFNLNSNAYAFFDRAQESLILLRPTGNRYVLETIDLIGS